MVDSLQLDNNAPVCEINPDRSREGSRVVKVQGAKVRNNWRGVTDHLPTALQTPHVSDTGYTPLLTDMWAWNTCLSEKEETV